MAPASKQAIRLDPSLHTTLSPRSVYVVYKWRCNVVNVTLLSRLQHVTNSINKLGLE